MQTTRSESIHDAVEHALDTGDIDVAPAHRRKARPTTTPPATTARRRKDVMPGTRTQRTAMLALVIGIAAITAGVTPGEARASAVASGHADPLIQPGAAVHLTNRPLSQYGQCTLGFVFRDRHDTYIGTSAFCSGTQRDDGTFGSGVGNRAVMSDREFGTIVYWLKSGTGPNSAATPPWQEDFALIRVDRSEVHRVSPVVADVGQAPHGITTSTQASDGSLVFASGSGVGMAQKPTRHRIGALVAHDDRGFQLAFAGSAGDGGAPVLYPKGNTFNAYGVLSPFDHTSGMTIERVMLRLAEAGFDLELVTGVDNSVVG